MMLVLNNPVAAAVPANKEEGRFRSRPRRGRFLCVHNTSPCGYVTSPTGRRQRTASGVEVRNPDRTFQRDDPHRCGREQRNHQNQLAEALNNFHVRCGRRAIDRIWFLFPGIFPDPRFYQPFLFVRLREISIWSKRSARVCAPTRFYLRRCLFRQNYDHVVIWARCKSP